MARIALVYGLIAGVIVIVSIILSLVLAGSQHVAGLQWLGYLIMFLALSLIFFGVKRYRDRELGGAIRFLPALGMGLLIAVIASVVYVVVWELYLAATNYAFMADYADAVIAERQAQGLSGEALESEIAAMEELEAQYANPLFRLPITFLEIFPVGLLVSLVSAALLRNPRIAPARA